MNEKNFNFGAMTNVSRNNVAHKRMGIALEVERGFPLLEEFPRMFYLLFKTCISRCFLRAYHIQISVV